MAWGLTEVVEHLAVLGIESVPASESSASSGDEAVVALSADTPEEHRPATLRLVGSEPTSRLLRVSVAQPFRASAGVTVDDVRLAGALLAPYLVLGHTEVDDDGALHHRYAMPVDTTAGLPAGVLTQVISVLDYEQVHFGDYLEALCRGDVGVDLFAELVARGEAAELD